MEKKVLPEEASGLGRSSVLGSALAHLLQSEEQGEEASTQFLYPLYGSVPAEEENDPRKIVVVVQIWAYGSARVRGEVGRCAAQKQISVAWMAA